MWMGRQGGWTLDGGRTGVGGGDAWVNGVGHDYVLWMCCGWRRRTALGANELTMCVN